MKVEAFLRVLGAEFYTGVPDSLLKALLKTLSNSVSKLTLKLIKNLSEIWRFESNCLTLQSEVYTINYF